MSRHVDLQSDLAARLTADSYFETIAIRREYADEAAGDALLTDQILAVLNGQQLTSGKCGLAISISSAKGKPTNPNGGSLLLDYTFEIEITEHKALNFAADIGTGIRCDDAAVRVMHLVHAWSPNSKQAFLVLDFEEAVYPGKELGDLRGWIITVQITAQRTAGTERCARPIITDGPVTLTMSCATPDAEIYFTRDGSLPTPTNGTLYTAVIDDDTTDTIRAIAYKSGITASDVAQLELS